jgi:hypothetical protein
MPAVPALHEDRPWASSTAQSAPDCDPVIRRKRMKPGFAVPEASARAHIPSRSNLSDQTSLGVRVAHALRERICVARDRVACVALDAVAGVPNPFGRQTRARHCPRDGKTSENGTTDQLGLPGQHEGERRAHSIREYPSLRAAALGSNPTPPPAQKAPLCDDRIHPRPARRFVTLRRRRSGRRAPASRDCLATFAIACSPSIRSPLAVRSGRHAGVTANRRDAVRSVALGTE